MKVFISYHRADKKFKDQLITALQQNNIDYYCVPEDYSFDGMKHPHIAQIIIENMNDCQVTVCIIGKETYTRPHVDHELKATLKGDIETRRGLVGVMLENRGDSKNKINYDTFPNRIQDNEDYTVLIQNASLSQEIALAVQEAFDRSNDSSYIVDNSRPLMELRKGRYYDQ